MVVNSHPLYQLSYRGSETGRRLYVPVPSSGAPGRQARWQSGDAEACKASYVGSIPARASKFNILILR